MSDLTRVRDMALALAIIEMIIKYGPTAVIAISGALSSGSPSAQDIRDLFVKLPEEYFDESS